MALSLLRRPAWRSISSVRVATISSNLVKHASIRQFASSGNYWSPMHDDRLIWSNNNGNHAQHLSSRSYAPSQRYRLFSTNIHQRDDEDDADDAAKVISNRAAFKAIPVIPSILQHIEKIGVGAKPKRSKHDRRKKIRTDSGGGGSRGKGKSNDSTLDEREELDYFAENDAQHRIQWRTKRVESSAKGTTKHSNDTPERRGAYWLPPPPFSSTVKDGVGNKPDSLHGHRIIRRPVKLLGKAGSLNDKLPRDNKNGMAEVAIAGRSNVGKSTLLNALLYGNIDEELGPRKYQPRGQTPDRVKLPKGVKAITSAKPGQTKELSFYQLSADVVSASAGDDGKKKLGKMSLCMIDLPGYGFAFAKEERTVEWKNLMHYYLLERRSLKRILLLLDARHGFKQTDFEFMGDLQEGLMARADGKKRELPPIQIVLTKCDLVKQADLARRVVLVRQQLSDFLIREPSQLPVMLVSARAGVGYNNIKRETPMGGVLELQRELASLVPMPRVGKK